MEEILGPQLLSGDKLIPTSCLSQYKNVLLYFAAHWCPPCRGFNQQLSLFYHDVNKKAKDTEVILVSMDQTAENFATNYEEMYWLAIPFEDFERRNRLMSSFDIQHLPVLCLLDSQGRLLKDTCRRDVIDKGIHCLPDWEAAHTYK